jgi:hypothetical protein
MLGIFPAAYRPISWPVLASNLAELLNGNPVPAYKAYSDNWMAGLMSDETGIFVVLNDRWKTGPEAPAHNVSAIRDYFLNEPVLSHLITRYQASFYFDHAFWLLPTTHNFHPQYYPEYPSFKTANPILILSTTYDPVCPLVSAKKAHDSFEGSGFVEQKSYGHCSTSMASLCMAKHVQNYFYDGVLPPPGSTCVSLLFFFLLRTFKDVSTYRIVPLTVPSLQTLKRVLMNILRCEIDLEYFPDPTKSPLTKILSVEDAKLLSALEELAHVDIL